MTNINDITNCNKINPCTSPGPNANIIWESDASLHNMLLNGFFLYIWGPYLIKPP